MKRKPKIGLLPMYLKLYDDTTSETRKAFVPFLKLVADGFITSGVEVVQADICRLKGEFNQAVSMFEKDDVDCIVTLHLAYSPSMESIQALCGSGRPILILDTTMDHDFGLGVDPSRIMYNHGIHGVMDLASVLRRRGKSFMIVSGHISESNVMERAAAIAHAACAARCFRNTKVLRIGESFKGMGDFSVSEKVLKKVLSFMVDQIEAEALASDVEAISEDDIAREITLDRDRFVVEAAEEVHRRSVRVGLGLRRYLEAGGYDAFSMNFMAFNSEKGPVDTVPFLEASKAMARGIGYAGEGDVLTAALVGALLCGFGKTTFTEIFCPDWKGNSLFLSHMGEVNPEIAAEKPRVIEKDFPYTAAQNPAIITCAPKPGPAVFVNLAPGPDNTFNLIVVPVEVLGDTINDAMKGVVRGWVRPVGPVPEFLEVYSRHGGTHHSALVLDQSVESLRAFAEFAGISYYPM